MTTFELPVKDIETGFGRYDRAVNSGLNFWTWWSRDPDSDRSLSSSPSDALVKTLMAELAGDESPEKTAKVIARATRLLTLDRFTDAYSIAVNEMCFIQATGEPLNGMAEGIEDADVEVLREFVELTSR